MLLRTSEVPEALDSPELSATKRLRQWFRAGPEPAEVPGLDVRALQIQYGPDQARRPQLLEATFRVGLGTSMDAYQRIRDDAINRWITTEIKRGWDPVLDSQHPVRVLPYLYPAYDLDNLPDLSRREFKVTAWFTCRNPQPKRIEINPRLLQPVRAGGT